MELRHLRHFVAVAEERSFTRAAARLFMAQPPLSYSIRQLETEVGTPLLSRTSRHVEVTEAGCLFLERARKILRDTEEAAEQARRIGKGEAGWLAIGFVGTATADVLPSAVRLFRERHPAVELSLVEMPTAEQAEALRTGSLHIGLLRPFDDPLLVMECLRREPLMIALPSAHPLASEEEVSLTALSGDPFVSFVPSPLGPSCGEYVLGACAAAGFVPRVQQAARDVHGVLALVAAGVGVTVVPESSRNALPREGLALCRIQPILPDAAKDPDASAAPLTVALALARRRGEENPAVRRFYEAVRDAVQGMG